MTKHRSSTFAILLFGEILAACEPIPGTGTSSSSSASSGGSSGTSDASSTSSTTRPRLDAQKLCTRLIDECGQALTMPECISTFGPLRVTESCIAGIDSATCAALNASSSSVLTTCFPPCSGTIASCNTDGTLSLCTAAGTTQVTDCHDSCVATGFSGWTRTCGTSFEGQVSDRAQCWCK